MAESPPSVDRALVACKCCRLLVRCVKTEGSPIFAQYRRGDDRAAATEASVASDRWIPACYDCKCLQRNASECAGCAARLAEKRSRLEADVAAAEAAVDAAVASFRADDAEAAAGGFDRALEQLDDALLLTLRVDEANDVLPEDEARGNAVLDEYRPRLRAGALRASTNGAIVAGKLAS